MRYVVIIEKGRTSYGAFVPDLPGCIAVGETQEEVMVLIEEAIQFHIEGLKLENREIPQPVSSSAFVDIPLYA